MAAFSHGGEAGSPELSVYSIAEGVVPGGVAGVAREARRLEVSSSAQSTSPSSRQPLPSARRARMGLPTSRHPCEDDVAAFSHGSEAGSPELSVYSITEGVVPGGVAGVASEARRLEVSSSAVDETELPPAIAVCTKGADGLADQRLEHRREEAKARRNHRLKLTVVEYVLPAWPGHQLDTGDSAR